MCRKTCGEVEAQLRTFLTTKPNLSEVVVPLSNIYPLLIILCIPDMRALRSHCH